MYFYFLKSALAQVFVFGFGSLVLSLVDADSNNNSFVCYQPSLLNFDTSGQLKLVSSRLTIYVTRTQGAATSRRSGRDTGPRFDHTSETNSGSYILFPGTVFPPGSSGVSQCGKRSDHSAKIDRYQSTVNYTAPANAVCTVDTWYSMQGVGVPCLGVDVLYENDEGPLELFNKCGNQNTGDGWKKETSKTFSPNGRQFKLVINVFCPLMNASKDDAAIDDVQLTCNCPNTTVSTTAFPISSSNKAQVSTATMEQTKASTTTRLPLTTALKDDHTTDTKKDPGQELSEGDENIEVIALWACAGSFVFLALVLIIVSVYFCRQSKQDRTESEKNNQA